MGPVPNHRPFSMLKLSTGSAKNKEELADFMSEITARRRPKGPPEQHTAPKLSQTRRTLTPDRAKQSVLEDYERHTAG